jgi:hypothetical protein
MTSTLTQPFASAGFSVQRTEITSVMQPTYAEYFVSDGSALHLVLKRKPDLGLEGVSAVRIFVNEFNELSPDNFTNDTTFANGGEFLYSDQTTYDPGSGAVNTPNGIILFNSGKVPVSGATIKVVYFINPEDYTEYEDGVLRNLALDLCLHPYKNNYTPAFEVTSQASATLRITGAIGVGASITANIAALTPTSTWQVGGVDSTTLVGKRIREVDGTGIATITAAIDATNVAATVDVAFSKVVAGDKDYVSGEWLLIIPEADVEAQPYNLIYPFQNETAVSPITIGIDGQQDHTEVMSGIRRIGNLLVVESEKATDLLSSIGDINSVSDALPTSLTLPSPVRSRRSPQKWRIRFYYDERDDYVHVNVGTKYQLLDNGNTTRGQSRDGQNKSVFRLPGELSEVYFDPSDDNGKGKSGFFRRQGKTTSDTNNTYPITYRLTCTDHGTSLFMFDQAAVDQDDDYAWFVVQRHVDNSSGKIEFEDGKSPVHCVYSPSKRPFEASEINSGYFSSLSKQIDFSSSPFETTSISADLQNVYDVAGRRLKPGNMVDIEIITDTKPIPQADYGSSINYIGPNMQTIYGDPAKPLNSNDNSGFVTDKATVGKRTTSSTVDEYEHMKLNEYDEAFNNKLGPAMLGLIDHEVVLMDTITNLPHTTLVRDVDYEIVVDIVVPAVITAGVITTPQTTSHELRFLHPTGNPLEIGGVIFPNSTSLSGTPTQMAEKSPEVVVRYRWKGAGYDNQYINPFGRLGDTTAMLEDAARVKVFVELVEMPHARTPYEYTITSTGDVLWPSDLASFQGTSLNTYVYSIPKDTIFIREVLPEGTVLKLQFQNYAEDPDANNLYLIKIPEDPDFPNTWTDMHREAKGIYRFVVREYDVLKPWDYHVSAVIPQIDSPAIINPVEQLSITQDKTFVFNFPTPMASQRYIYPNSEMDMICFSSADSSTEGGITNVGTATSPKYDLDGQQDSSIGGGNDGASTLKPADTLNYRAAYTWHTGTDSATTSANRTYAGMQSTKPNGNGMRIFTLVRGGPIRPEYSDWTVRT